MKKFIFVCLTLLGLLMPAGCRERQATAEPERNAPENKPAPPKFPAQRVRQWVLMDVRNFTIDPKRMAVTATVDCPSSGWKVKAVPMVYAAQPDYWIVEFYGLEPNGALQASESRKCEFEI